MRVRLTETAINKATRDAILGARRIDLTDPDQKGLVLRVGKSGSATWTLACKDPLGKFKRIMIGGYPAIGLRAARAQARSLREDVRNGTPRGPVARSKCDMTLKGLFELYATQGQGSKLKSWSEARKRLASMFTRVMEVPLAELSLDRLQYVLDRHGMRSPASAAWGLRSIRPILKWAGAPGRGLVPKEFASLSYDGKVSRRQRVLNEDELVAVLLAMKRLAGQPYIDCMQFIMLTLLRRSEAVHIRWQDVTFGDEPHVRIVGTKNGLDHKVPLSRQGVQLLMSWRDGGNPKATDLVFYNGDGGLLVNWTRAQRLINGASGTSAWHRHDLRRTGTTILGEMGFEPHILEAALNHTAIHSPLAATYNRSRYRPQVKEALQRLADKLDELVGERSDRGFH
jgi:integrase